MKVRIELTKPTGHVTMSSKEYNSCDLYAQDDGTYKLNVMGCLRELVKVVYL